MLNFINNHFAHVAPILACGAIAIIIILDRVRAVMMTYPLHGTEAFFEKIRSLIMADRISEAIALCERYRSKPVANVVREGLLRAHQPEALIEHGLQIAVGDATDKTTARTAFLATLANVATLLGLLGTIVGLVQSFEAVGNANAQMKSAMLAAGISTAMNATMLGLGVAVPCMVFYSIIMNKTNRMNAQIDRAAIRILDLLKQRYFSNETPHPNDDGGGFGHQHHAAVGGAQVRGAARPGRRVV
jgi:biopolymer transport protein ExbB/TolQ